MMRDSKFDDTDQFFTVNELQWNRGASQQSEKELREAYLEVEMFDSRLWVRAGKQTIVWGKTELFRNQDQFNPVDIAIGPLASLEESRIALWALRGIWSFYEIGPLEDVRLELVGIYDDFEPTDLGICGEPFVPRAVCLKGYGLWAHANTGAGVAGEIRPPDPWNSWKGIEGGARLEFRWDRFSFALTDYYGFTDTPYQDLIFQYSRNVDPVTGRPREAESEGRCVTGNEPACLTPAEAIEKHSVNQQIFHWICASTVGVAPTVDPTACAQTLFNSKALSGGTGPEFAITFSAVMSGRPVASNSVFPNLGSYEATAFPQQNAIVTAALNRFSAVGPIPSPLVELHNGGPAIEGPRNTFPVGTDATTLFFNNQTNISQRLTDWQEALLGCGNFYQTGCDLNGIDLLNAEASAMVQSFAWIEGTEKIRRRWDTTDASVAQPGTVGFNGPPVCTRYNRKTGQNDILPGCRGPGDPGYDPTVDGDPTNLFHPFTGQRFRSEMAALSWNFQMLAATLGSSPDTPSWSTFDPNRPFRANGCSWRMPQFCSFISGIAGLTRITSTSVRAGGNGEYGRRHWVWSGVGTLALQYEKRNVVGFSMDFAEDTTKSSWGVEYTYSEGMPFTDNGDQDLLSYHGVHQLTISVDRPTFINFLNNNRTFFINSQLFIGYTENFQRRMTVEGPWNFLWLVTANTGYFQDRMLAGITLVWDFQSNSGAFLPNVQYRFTENFSATVGAAFLTGKYSPKPMGISRFSASGDTQQGDRIWVENGISPARDLDNFFFRLRYTF
jgi:hypothetical protein